MRDYRKLTVFGLADDLVIEVYRLTAKFPAEERYGLSSQMRRAIVSVTSNIVEGSSRESEVEYRRYVEMAYSSAREVAYQLTIARRLEYPCD